MSPDDLPRNAIPDALLDRYLAGECTPEEERRVRDALDSDPRPAIRASLEAIVPQGAFDTERAWQAVRARTAAGAPRLLVFSERRMAMRSVARVAFHIATAAAAGIGVVSLTHFAKNRFFPSPPGVSFSTLHEDRSGIGQRRELRLEDGTVVILAPESVLRRPWFFDEASREVALEGEAYFVVRHDPKRPFSVRAGNAVTRVLGTQFGVRARDGSVQVVVATGRVLLRAASDSTGPTLTAGDLGRLDSGSTSPRVTHGVPLDAYVGWRTGRIAAAGRPLAELLPELTRWFGVEFVVPDSALAARRVSADLRVGRGAQLDPLLDALALALDARWSRQGRTVTLMPKQP